MSKIEVKLKPLWKVLNDREFFYKIPDYQRPYSWEKDQISELVDDLTSAYKNNYSESYFCGSLVLVNNEHDERYDVIDGQQRLTTFTLLCCVIRDCYVTDLDKEANDFINRAIRDEYETNKARLKFLTSLQMRNDFEEEVLNGINFENINNPEKSFPKNRYLQNAYYLRDFLKEKFCELNITPNDFVKWVFKNVALTVLITPNLNNAIKIFNVLNNRGLELRPMDILKSQLMVELNTEDRTTFRSKWENIDEKFKINDDVTFEDMLIAYLYYKSPSNPQYRYDEELIKKFKSDDMNPLAAVFEIGNFADAYIDVINSNDKYVYLLRYLPHKTYWHSIVATAKYSKYIDYNELLKILTAYYYQNWIGGGTIARTKQSSFNILKAVKEKKTIVHIKEICKNNLNQYSTTKYYKSELLGNNIYGRRWDKPILLLIEYFMKENSDFISISNKIQVEHILPQTTEKLDGTKSEWEQLFTADERKVLTNCLGNLTLLSMKKNIQAYNYSFASKIKAYKDKDNVRTPFAITQKIWEDYSVWNKESIEKRKAELVDFIHKHLDIFE